MITLNAGSGVQVVRGFPIEFATSNGAVINVTQGTVNGMSGIVTLGPGGYFYPAYAPAGTMSFTVESGSIYALNGVGATTPASMTVTQAAVDVTGAAGAFTWNPVTGVLTATGSINVAPAAVTPVAPVAAGTSSGAMAAVTPLASTSGLASSPGLAGTAAIQPQFNAEGLAAWAQSLSGITGAELDAGLAAVPS